MTKHETIQIKQQLIRSLLQNLDWETNPKTLQDLYNIRNEIYQYWTQYKHHNYNQTTKEFQTETN